MSDPAWWEEPHSPLSRRRLNAYPVLPLQRPGNPADANVNQAEDADSDPLWIGAPIPLMPGDPAGFGGRATTSPPSNSYDNYTCRQLHLSSTTLVVNTGDFNKTWSPFFSLRQNRTSNNPPLVPPAKLLSDSFFQLLPDNYSHQSPFKQNPDTTFVSFFLASLSSLYTARENDTKKNHSSIMETSGLPTYPHGQYTLNVQITTLCPKTPRAPVPVAAAEFLQWLGRDRRGLCCRVPAAEDGDGKIQYGILPLSPSVGRRRVPAAAAEFLQWPGIFHESMLLQTHHHDYATSTPSSPNQKRKRSGAESWPDSRRSKRAQMTPISTPDPAWLLENAGLAAFLGREMECGREQQGTTRLVQFRDEEAWMTVLSSLSLLMRLMKRETFGMPVNGHCTKPLQDANTSQWYVYGTMEHEDACWLADTPSVSRVESTTECATTKHLWCLPSLPPHKDTTVPCGSPPVLPRHWKIPGLAYTPSWCRPLLYPLANSQRGECKEGLSSLSKIQKRKKILANGADFLTPGRLSSLLSSPLVFPLSLSTRRMNLFPYPTTQQWSGLVWSCLVPFRPLSGLLIEADIKWKGLTYDADAV
ncbi:hypothetical protein GGS20DRAFT_594654 [Poronia punctata]|nr:hypothetical protein GGS20DRAFT_594654 [Poronia punctata]